ncbi:transglutaminase-like domain-containing protein [Leptospira sp. FAT2]|uniref:transglutaminase-like domain-containing protein n=1 Tax=Leptospira sanjuanensis TaxID=2879643 RepID=UPI001EE8423A|nr:transglutaminase-like domain-containing protein [Leptospira sanjuanensis]MCG6168733.1 transglutaminase-like domain-containing protein [Leptospira sanjuanensis]MCG6194148.1 transglutaminase-like domain-containing protein [Leptospira sanjuanensis]
MQSLESTLKSTYYLDHDSESVRKFLERVTSSGNSPLEKLAEFYLGVRDQIRYNPYQVNDRKESYKSSTIADSKQNYCIPKSILFASGARALGFPSRIGFSDVVNHLASERLIRHLGTTTFAFHGYAEILIDGVWVKATPVFDKELCIRFGVAPLDFDGKNDTIFHSFDGEGKKFMEYVNHRGVFEDFPFEFVIQGLKDFYPNVMGKTFRGDLRNEKPLV